MALQFRYGNLIPTSTKVYYLSHTLSFDRDKTDFGDFEIAMRQAAGNPKNYQFATSESFDSKEDSDDDLKIKKDELENNDYTVKMLTVKV